MSVSLRFWANGDMSGSMRRPSRYLMSCQWVKYTGWPASEGVPGMEALPSGPWHAAHTSAFRRPASMSAASARPARASAAQTARSAIALPSLALRLIDDPVDRPGVVVGDQERAVLHLPRVDRPAPD